MAPNAREIAGNDRGPDLLGVSETSIAVRPIGNPDGRQRGLKWGRRHGY